MRSTDLIEIVEDCQLEWHKRRGVLYIHNKETGRTLLRISGLPKAKGERLLEIGQVDVKADDKYSTVPAREIRKIK